MARSFRIKPVCKHCGTTEVESVRAIVSSQRREGVLMRVESELAKTLSPPAFRGEPWYVALLLLLGIVPCGVTMWYAIGHDSWLYGILAAALLLPVACCAGANDRRRRGALQVWNRLLDRWGQLIYCDACHVVTYPPTGQFASAEWMHELLADIE